MVNDEQEEFMKQCMDTCKEHVEKLAKDPELFSKTLEPFIRMSQEFMAGNMPTGMLPDMASSSSMTIDAMIDQNKKMVDYVEKNYSEFKEEDSKKLKELYKLIKKLRTPLKEILSDRGLLKSNNS